MFSVIIPLFNKEKSIKGTLLSVLNQTFSDFEVIVVNDGSSDNSVSEVESLLDSRVKIIHQNNSGVSAARNRGVLEAKYEWIAFIDGDDIWEDYHLEEVTKMMEKFPNNSVYATSFKYSNNKKMFHHPRTAEIFKIENYFKEAILEYIICTDVVVIKKDAFLETGGFNNNLSRGEDLDLWARLARKYSIIKSRKVTAIYRIEAENRSDRTFNLEKSRVYNYDFSQSNSIDETNYYKHQITKSLRGLIKKNDYYKFFKLYIKHNKYISIFNILRKSQV